MWWEVLPDKRITLILHDENMFSPPLYNKIPTDIVSVSRDTAEQVYSQLDSYSLIVGAAYSYQLDAWNRHIPHVPLISIDATASIPPTPTV